MKINELTAGASVSVNVVSEVDEISFSTTIAAVESDYILVEPITNEGQPISFKSDLVRINLIYPRENSNPIIWFDIQATYLLINDDPYHKIMAAREGNPQNRRGGFRLYLGLAGVLQIGANRKAIDIIVKDVSSTGFAIVTEEDFSEAGIAHMTVNYSGIVLKLKGKCVRKVQISEKKYILGYKLIESSDKLGKFIATKQRELLQQRKTAK